MAKIKTGLMGASGRMGLEICEKIRAKRGFEATAAIARNATSLSPFKAVYKSLADAKSIKLDVLIDFSTVEAFDQVLRFCLAQRVPLVTGVTGLSNAQQKKLLRASEKIPVFYSANMSIGIAAVKKAMEVFSKISGFDFQIVESHHKNKKDKPSGTALSLQAELEKVTKKKWPDPISYRVGGVIGEHEIVAASEGEIIRISHEALSRGIFAEGALKAAEFIVKQPAGLYSMSDIFSESN